MNACDVFVDIFAARLTKLQAGIKRFAHSTSRASSHCIIAQVRKLATACLSPGRVAARQLSRQLSPQASRSAPRIRVIQVLEFIALMVPRGGIEPPTRGFSVRCS